MNGRPPRWKTNAAIVGLGITEMGKIYGRRRRLRRPRPSRLALEDAGLAKSDIDGLLINGNGNVDMDPRLQISLGSRTYDDELMSAAGSTVRRDGPVRERSPSTLASSTTSSCSSPTRRCRSVGAGAAYAARGAWDGMNGLKASVYGEFGGNTAVRAGGASAHGHVRHDERTARRDRRRAAAVGDDEPARADGRSRSRWRTTRPPAWWSSRSTCSTAASSRTAPSRSIVTTADRAQDLRQPPVYVWAAAQAAPGDNQRSGCEPGVDTGAKRAGEQAFCAGRHHPRRRRRARALRLLHLHRPGHAGGLRLLREGRRRRRSSTTASSVPAARCRPTPAAASSRATTCGA